MSPRTRNGLILATIMVPILMLIIGMGFKFRSLASPQSNKWVSAWYASPQKPLEDGISHNGIHQQTIRMVVQPHMDGNKLRIHLSNAFGTRAVTFKQVDVALTTSGAKTNSGSHQSVTFKGKKAITISKGDTDVSDPISMKVKSNDNLTVSLYVQDSGPVTWHRFSMQRSYLANGNHVTDNDKKAYLTSENAWFWLNGIDVYTRSSVKGTIAVLGDSIANGNHSTEDTNRRWPDDLARRLNTQMPMTWSVVNAGLSGNRLLTETPDIGEKLEDRLQRDAFNLTDIQAIILHEGLNDIRQHPDETSADDIIVEMKKIISLAHKHHLKIYGATLGPYEGSSLYTSKGEKTRAAVNHWIRTSDAFDGVIDFDKTLRDPKDPQRYRPGYHAEDNFHPNDRGYQAMANAIKLSLFK
ncbi:lysophospholipase L1-like esterase [Pullulanibacillus pueri]|uniref:SGNH hydrolase n=1 Tax=Pullulanibacillus pueri TaxID=1437324 RepID=A0A8J3EKV6_9BACL|nr:SGNH/GDSL hydrolase family protein [Pullulanibacillus pueri]MBM7680848.1 lysophospholipase L1-like esterase [Pullulanibacillus pueri]GGH78565.1 SGNH hydrolase [Pullulanibacillus pueri]